jgi:hypothetical protein
LEKRRVRPPLEKRRVRWPVKIGGASADLLKLDGQHDLKYELALFPNLNRKLTGFRCLNLVLCEFNERPYGLLPRFIQANERSSLVVANEGTVVAIVKMVNHPMKLLSPAEVAVRLGSISSIGAVKGS